MNTIKVKDTVTVQYQGGLRAGGTVLCVIQLQGKEPEFIVSFPQIYGTSGHFQLNQIINHVSV